MKVKKPKIIETVGALYYAFNNPTIMGFDSTSFEDVVKSPIIKKVSVEPEAETAVVRASGENYDEISQTSSIGLEFETVAFDPGDLAKAKGEEVDDSGLVFGGASNQRPYVAIGYPVIKVGGEKCLKWYPKCKLVENSEEASTSEDSFSEQNPTVNFSAYSFDDKGNKFIYLDTEMDNFPEGMTEELFFSKVITSKNDINSLLHPTEENQEENLDETPEA